MRQGKLFQVQRDANGDIYLWSPRAKLVYSDILGSWRCDGDHSPILSHEDLTQLLGGMLGIRKKQCKWVEITIRVLP